MLTSYGGTAISYDAIGNPTNWRNANYLTWKARELQSLSVTGGPSVSFEYNSDGIRTKKTVGGSVIHNYILDGSNIIRETVTGGGNSYTLYYLYDTSGSVQGFIYNNSYYYFQKNLQGDVVRILDYSGNVVVEYTYDAWGKVLSVTGSQASTIGQYNPFRYRSYYYDTETGFYYLQSRYYDPTVGRFLNADHPELVGANGGIQGYNLFAYCNNNPVMKYDPYGEWTFTISFNIDLVFLLGYSISSDISFDDNGGFMLTMTETDYFDEESNDVSVGCFSASATIGLQVTSHETVDDLLGESISIGGSIGSVASVGLDLVADDVQSDEFRGVKVSVGVGVGIDVHVKRTTTKRVIF